MTKIARRANDVVTKRMDLPLEVRSVDMRKREIRGWATMATPDRMLDVVVPTGAKLLLPLPLLWQHDTKAPIGRVTHAEVSARGIYITAQFAEGVGMADEAWAMVQADLVTSMSIGFPAIESEPLKNGGRKFVSWELLEISCVTVPAHPDAKIERGERKRGGVKLIQEQTKRGPVKLIAKPKSGAIKLMRSKRPVILSRSGK